MKSEDIFEGITQIREDIVERAGRGGGRRRGWRGCAAAVVALAVIAGGYGAWRYLSTGAATDGEGASGSGSQVDGLAPGGAGSGESGLCFEKGKYTVVGVSRGGNRDVPSSFDELEARARYSIDGEENKNGVIIQCSVDGASVNRIIEPSEEERDKSKIYGINHVLTPIKVEKIFYAGSNVNIEEGGVYLVKEPFFYITDESCEPYFSTYGPGTIYSEEYTPLQKGNQYIAYMTLLDDDIYNYNDEPILSLIGLQEAVYCAASEADAKAVTAEADGNYWTLWEAVMENYLNLW